MWTIFERVLDPLAGQTAERPPRRVREFFLFYLWPIRRLLFLTLLLVGIGAAAEMLLFVFLGNLLDWMTDTPPAHFWSQHAGALLLMLLVVAVIRPVALLASRALINLALAPGISSRIRWQNHRYVLRQSLRFFQNDFAGRIAQKVLQTGNAVRESVINVVDGVWMLVVYLIGIFLMFTDIEPLLLLPIGVWCVAYGLVIYAMVPPVRRKSANLSEANSVLSGRIVDGYTNIQSVKLFAHDQLEEAYVAEGITRYVQAFRRLMRAILGLTATLTAINTVLIVVMAGLSIHLWTQSLVSIGEITVVNSVILRLNQMSGWILRTITSLFENVGTVQNGIDTISRPREVVDREDAEALRVSEGRVEFREVSFDYDDSLPVLRDCSFELASGEKVGIVGRSGAGKSTLVNLLLRFHDVHHGSILIDCQNIGTVSQDSLRRAIGVVSQDTSLLHRSIRDNIRYGRADASDDEVLTAARRADALGFIETLADSRGRRGLDAFVGERGVKLSGGQRQRIAIARAILKNAPILVLDEATSALDSEAEAVIQEQLQGLMRGKTVLAVAHRLSTIASLDRLIVLEHGRVAESGTHTELLASGGLYADLWARQSGGFLGE